MVYFYQLFSNTDDVILKLYTILCKKQNVLSLFGALYWYWHYQFVINFRLLLNSINYWCITSNIKISSS